MLIVNEGEAAALLDGTVPAQTMSTPRAGIARDDAGDLTAALLALGPAAVVITLGARGAAWRTGDAAGTVAAPPVDVVDTTGAGDAFVGAFAAALAHVALAEADLVDADLADADGVDADSVDGARVDAALVDHSRSGGDITGSAVAAAVEAGVDHASWATTFAGAQPPGSFPAPDSFPVR